MATSVLLLALIVGTVWPSVHSFKDGLQATPSLDNGQQATPSVPMMDRLDMLETQFRHQQDHAHHQQRLLSQYQSQLTLVKAQLRHQQAQVSDTQAELSDTKAQLTDTKAELKDSKTQLDETNAKLSEVLSVVGTQASELEHTKSELLQTRVGLSNTKEKLFQTQTELYDTKTLVHQLNNKLSYQESLLHQLKGAFRHLPEGPDFVTEEDASKTTRDFQHASLGKVFSSDVLSSPHKVKARSDDPNPLETVVDHLSQQLTEVTADIQSLKTSVSQHTQDIQDARRSTYTHWGSSQCHASSQLVYSGQVGGSWFIHPGAASNYLCLTMSPIPSPHSLHHEHAWLYGAEYFTHDSHQDLDAVCAVCRSGLSTTVMIPGTNQCTAGWTPLYSGFLMAGGYLESGSEYICVDSKLEAAVHSNAAEDGKRLKYTVTQCGSLPCPPYANNTIATCVVCGK